MRLREYQIKAVGESIAELSRHDAIVLQAPTGSGKTVMAAAVADYYLQKHQRVLFLLPRRELVDQTADKFDAIGYDFGNDYGIIMAGEEMTYWTLGCPLQIASKDTLHARTKSGRIELPEAALLIVDECHLSLSPTWLKLIDHYKEQGTHILGLTATPARGDGRGLGEAYSMMVQAPMVSELMNMGHLSRATYYAPTQVDLDGIAFDRKKHDYNETQLQERMSQQHIVGDIVEHWLKLAGGRRTVVFCAGVKHSILVRDRFRSQGIKADHVDGMTDINERKAIFDRFRSGETQVLTNCMVATYGFDLPEMDCVVLARPTQSIILHLQMLGRGLRTAEGKEDCLVLDHAGNVVRLGFASDEVPWGLEPTGNLYERIAQERLKKTIEDSEGIVCDSCGHIFTSARKCPSCGWELPEKKGKDINVADGELVSYTAQDGLDVDEIRRFYREMLGLCQLRNRKAGVAYFRTLAKYNYKAPYAWLQLPPLQPSETTIGYDKYQQIKYAKSRGRR